MNTHLTKRTDQHRWSPRIPLWVRGLLKIVAEGIPNIRVLQNKPKISVICEICGYICFTKRTQTAPPQITYFAQKTKNGQQKQMSKLQNEPKLTHRVTLSEVEWVCLISPVRRAVGLLKKSID